MTKFNPDIHHRHSIRLEGYDYSNAGAYFVTVCALSRECLFGDVVDGEMRLNEYGQVIHAYWQKVSDNFPNVVIDEYVIMPNHFHGIVTINTANDDIGTVDVGATHELSLHNETSIKYRKERRKMLLPRIIGWFKMNSVKQVNLLRDNPGCPGWQRNYYDHVVRTEDSLNRIRDYIRFNPSQWDKDIENPVIWDEKKAKAYYKDIL
ncbi:MAG: hypothetical protein HY786_00875 [Deltaproteobacteria bacterium]|nr:hypothetical protein [Deltaproteobacteria bacterium]